MSEKKFSPSPRFELKSAELDALRLEMQSATPEELKEFNDVVALAHELFLKKFGYLFTKENIIPPKRLQRTFLLTDKETFKTYQETLNETPYFDVSKKDKIQETVYVALFSFLQKKKKSIDNVTPQDVIDFINTYDEGDRQRIRQAFGVDLQKEIHSYLGESDEALFRAYVTDGRYVVGMANEFWDELTPEAKQGFRQLVKSEEDAKKLATQAQWLRCTLHELTHLYQKGASDPHVPYWLTELQASWAGFMLAPEMVNLISPQESKKVRFFEQLLKEYGDNVHKIIFNTPFKTQPKILDEIKKKFTPQVQAELFPNYKVVVEEK